MKIILHKNAPGRHDQSEHGSWATGKELQPHVRQALKDKAAPIISSNISKIAAARGLSEDVYRQATMKHMIKLLATAQPCIQINSLLLPRILNDPDNRIKSQFETNSSYGLMDKGVRGNYEAEAFGYPKNMDPSKRPIYGFLKTADTDKIPDVWQYGEVSIILKDEVKDRCTFTMDDSLNMVGMDLKRSLAWPSPINNPQIESGCFLASEDPWGGLDIQDPLTIKSLSACVWSGGERGTTSFNMPEYCEAQIHGGVKFSDIKEILFLKEPNDEIQKLMANKGISWRLSKYKYKDNWASRIVSTRDIMYKNAPGRHDQEEHGSWAEQFQNSDQAALIRRWQERQASHSEDEEDEEDWTKQDIEAGVALEFLIPGIRRANMTITLDEKKALYTYQINDYKTVNDYLRHGTNAYNKNYIEGIYNNMDSAIKKSKLSSSATVYRGMRDLTDFGYSSLDELVGAKITDKGFMSTTLDESVAKGKFYGQRGVVLVIDLAKDSHGVYMPSTVGDFQDESEILLPRNTTINIDKVERRGAYSFAHATIVKTKEKKNAPGRHDQSEHGNWAGHDKDYYHGRTVSSREFSYNYVGKGNDEQGPGFYFTTSHADANTYAGTYVQGSQGIVITAKLDPRKLVPNDKPASPKEVRWMIENAPDKEMALTNWDEDPKVALNEAVKSMIQYTKNAQDTFQQVWADFYKDNPKEYLQNMVKLGYDGHEVAKANGVTHVVVYNPDIIKQTDLPEKPSYTITNHIKEITEKNLEDIINDKYKLPDTLKGKTPDEIKAVLDENAKTMFKDTVPCIQMPLSAFTKFAKEGTIKNIFETNSTSAALWREKDRHEQYLADRKRGEQELFGIPLDAPAIARPIYGFIHEKTLPDVTNSVAQYGDVMVVLNRDKLVNKITITNGDSLDNLVHWEKEAEDCQVTMDKFKDPHYLKIEDVSKEGAEDMVQYWQDNKDRMESNIRAPPEPYDNPSWRTQFYGYVNDEIKDVKNLSDARPLWNYIECQIHSNVTMDNIKKVVFYKEPPKYIVNMLNKKGIEIEKRIKKETKNAPGKHDQSEHGSWSQGSKEEPSYDAKKALEDFKDWTSSLSPDELQSLDLYKGEMFGDINDALRQNGFLDENQESIVKDIENSLSRAYTNEDIRTYRGLVINTNYNDTEQIKNLKVGDTFIDKAFVSTSLDKNVALHFGSIFYKDGYQPTLCEIDIPKGTHAAFIEGIDIKQGNLDGEQEVLINRNHDFTVKGERFENIRINDKDIRFRVLTMEAGAEETFTTNTQSMTDIDKKLKSDYVKQMAGKLNGWQHNSIEEYQSTGYEYINEYLRHQDTGSVIDDSEVNQTVTTLDAAMKNCKSVSDITVYRGIDVNMFNEMAGDSHPSPRDLIGKEFIDKAFVSTSIDPLVARRFTELNPRILLEISVPKDTHSIYMPAIKDFNEEKELLIDRNTRFKIVSVVKDKDALKLPVFHGEPDIKGKSTWYIKIQALPKKEPKTKKLNIYKA